MCKKVVVWGLGLAFLLSAILIAQTSSFDGLIEMIEGLLENKETTVQSTFLIQPPSEEKAVGESITNSFAEAEVEEPTAPSESIPATILPMLSDKPMTLEQSFLMPSKEPDSIGNTFDEEPSE